MLSGRHSRRHSGHHSVRRSVCHSKGYLLRQSGHHLKHPWDAIRWSHSGRHSERHSGPCWRLFKTPFMTSYGTPFGSSFGRPFGTPFETPFATLFETLVRTPFGTFLGTPFETLLGTHIGTLFKTPFATPFVTFRALFETPIRTTLKTLWFVEKKWQVIFILAAESLSLDDLVYLFIWFACLVNFFLKFFHSPQFLTDSFHIKHESSLEGSAFGLWLAWRYGEFWRFGDHQQNGHVYSDATNKFMNTLVCVHVSEMRGSDVTVTVRAQIHKYILFNKCIRRIQ